MKLKTIKDFKIIKHDYCGMHCPPYKHYHNPKDTVDIKDLKKELIKWYKQLQKGLDDDFDYCEYNGVFSFIKHFGNLTEEDLK